MPQRHQEIKGLQVPNEIFLPQVLEEIRRANNKPAKISLRGNSMRPFLEDGRDYALLQMTDTPRVNDAVLAEITPGHYVLHRIIRIEGDKVTLRGDGNLNNEHCRLCDIRAKAIGFYRKGRQKADSTDGRKWRIYSWWWTRLYPIRRYLLFALYPHVPQRLKGKKVKK